MSFFLSALAIAAIVWFFPYILAFFGVLICLFMALIIWIKELLFPGTNK